MNPAFRIVNGHLLLILPLLLMGQGVQREVPFSGTDAPYGYFEYLPEGYTMDSEFSMILFLHGLGEIGDGETELYKLLAHGPHKMVAEGAKFPSVILSPQSVSWWDIDKIGAFVDWAFTKYSIDTTRLYVTGISMGGGGTWLYAVRFPEYPAAIVPICGAADSVNTAHLADIPVWAFHNQGDPVVKLARTLEWIAGIEDAGGRPELTIYPSNEHDAWTETYNNELVWQWIYAQKQGQYPLASIQNTVATVYPNPFVEAINITSSMPIQKARIMSTDGKMVGEISGGEQKDFSIKVDPSSAPGIYFLELISDDGPSRFRIIKK